MFHGHRECGGRHEADVVSFGADPVDVGDRDENDASMDEDGQALEVIGSGAGALEQGEEPLGCPVSWRPSDRSRTRSRARARRSRSKGFEEVIHCVHVEGGECVTIKRGDEDGHGHVLDADGFHDLKAVHFGHLNVEEDEVWL